MAFDPGALLGPEWGQQVTMVGVVALMVLFVAAARVVIAAVEGKASTPRAKGRDAASKPTTPEAQRRGSLGAEPRPQHVGILAAEIYFPSTYVRQAQLEKAHGVSQGKFTSGLGQSGMAFVGDREDINSIALTVVQNLLEKYEIPRERIGRLEVGTETLVDRAKSTKTVLMSLFEESGNTDIEGTTVVNACYGGTAALLNALAWVESSGWDGRYAIVVCADIAIYADGPAKPTGGCGAVAMLIGPNAPLVVDLSLRATHASNTWDFFKPRFMSEYPEVDGKMSKEIYLRALDDVYVRFAAKQEEWSGRPFTSDQLDYFCFHHPYNKLVQKAFGRLYFMDARRGKLLHTKEGKAWSAVAEWVDKPLIETYDDRDLDTLLRGLANERFQKRVSPSCMLSMQIGNTYTASVYLNLICLICNKGAALEGKRVGVYSFGSGALATMFQITGRRTGSRWTLQRIAETVDMMDRLHDREPVTPEELSEAIRIRERNVNRGGYTPKYSVSSLFPGTYYLEELKADFSRVYMRKPMNAPRLKGLFYPVHSTKVLSVQRESADPSSPVRSPMRVRELDLDNEPDAPADGTLLPSITTPSFSFFQESPRKAPGVKSPVMHMTPEETLHSMVKASLRTEPPVKAPTPIVITGVAAGLPGKDRDVFGPSNLKDLVTGVSFIGPVSDQSKQDMIERNVVQLKKNPDGSTAKLAADTEEKVIKLAAQLGKFELTKYGVNPALAATMDTVVQVAVAAGLEALKDAGIVRGEEGNLSSWTLPEAMRDSTGVVYATSFPALEAAVSEVMRFLHSKQKSMSQAEQLLSRLKQQLETACGSWDDVSPEDKGAFEQLEKSVHSTLEDPGSVDSYEFDRKFLFRILVLGNAQLAQIVGARGPNMQTNAACAGTTQAIAIAQDMIQQGRCERVIVIASDNASGEVLIPWLGSGFRALGAASIGSTVEESARPFDKRRKGLILGAGSIGMVLETQAAVARRFADRVGLGAPLTPSATGAGPVITSEHVVDFRDALKVRLVDTQYSNSAYHGAALDPNHIAAELERFLINIERKFGIKREEIAREGCYLSHETSTHASDASSCAANEVFALRKCFGDGPAGMESLTLLNTKGYTGHPMGVSFEDVAAVEILRHGVAPPVANYGEDSTIDPYLGKVKLGKGGLTNPRAKYALRFAAGFGSQVAFALYGAFEGEWGGSSDSTGFLPYEGVQTTPRLSASEST